MRKMVMRASALLLALLVAVSGYGWLPVHAEDVPAPDLAGTASFPQDGGESGGADVFLDEELLALARQDGSAAAQWLNAHADEALYRAGLKAVLDLYYGEGLEDRLAAFAACIDERAAEVLESYAAAQAQRNSPAPDFVPGEVLVVFAPEVDEAAAEQVVEEQEATLATVLPLEMDELVVVAEIPLDQTVEEAVAQFEADPAVEYAQPNWLYEFYDTVPDEAGWSGMVPDGNDKLNQWYHDFINTAGAWALLDNLSEREPVVVAVVDAAPMLDHEDLADVMLLEYARNFNYYGVGQGNYAWNKDGLAYNEPHPNFPETPYYWMQEAGMHGTMVSGIIGALTGNEKGGSGVAAGSGNQVVRIMPLNTGTYSGPGQGYANTLSLGEALAAISYAWRNGAQVINLSFGTYGYDQLLDRFISEAHAAGVTVVAAAGNSNREWTTGYTGMESPADLDNVISVINLTNPWPAVESYVGYEGNPRASSSNYGNKDIGAPGTGIESTTSIYNYNYQGYYTASSGTSFAAPVVSGVAAMLHYAAPGITPEQVDAILKITATDVYQPGYDSETAWGCVDAEMAVRMAVYWPSNLAAAEVEDGIALSWQAEAEGGEYQVYRAVNGGEPEPYDTITGWSYTDTAATQGHRYTYSVMPLGLRQNFRSEHISYETARVDLFDTADWIAQTTAAITALPEAAAVTWPDAAAIAAARVWVDDCLMVGIGAADIQGYARFIAVEAALGDIRAQVDALNIQMAAFAEGWEWDNGAAYAEARAALEVLKTQYSVEDSAFTGLPGLVSAEQWQANAVELVGRVLQWAGYAGQPQGGGYGHKEALNQALITLCDLEAAPYRMPADVLAEALARDGVDWYAQIKQASRLAFENMGSNSAADILSLRRHVLQQQTMEPLPLVFADMDEDGHVNVTDILYFRRRLLGLVA